MVSPSALPLEGDAVLDAVIAWLKADTGLDGVNTLTGGRIYRDMAPLGTTATAYPMVTVSPIDAEDFAMVDGDHEWAHVLILTKVTDRGTNNYGPTLTIAKRIAARLNLLERATQGDVYITRLRRRSSPAQPSDAINGVRFIYHNQVWFTEAQPA